MNVAPPPSGIAIRLESVTKTFRGGRDAVLKNLSLDFPEGSLTYVLGPSGTGKSVTLKTILGLLRPDSGRVLALGRDLSTLHGLALAEHRIDFGMLFQNSALFDDMTILENVSFPLREHTKLSDEEIRTRAISALKKLGFDSGYDKYPNELSGGMKKRVGLARAIIREPKVLLYDEPTTGLDPVTRRTVDELISKLKNELHLTSIVVSHDLPAALELADRIAFLFQGEVIYCGDPAGLRASKHPEIRKFLDAEFASLRALEGKIQ